MHGGVSPSSFQQEGVLRSKNHLEAMMEMIEIGNRLQDCLVRAARSEPADTEMGDVFVDVEPAVFATERCHWFTHSISFCRVGNFLVFLNPPVLTEVAFRPQNVWLWMDLREIGRWLSSVTIHTLTETILTLKKRKKLNHCMTLLAHWANDGGSLNECRRNDVAGWYMTKLGMQKLGNRHF